MSLMGCLVKVDMDEFRYDTLNIIFVVISQCKGYIKVSPRSMNMRDGNLAAVCQSASILLDSWATFPLFCTAAPDRRQIRPSCQGLLRTATTPPYLHRIEG